MHQPLTRQTVCAAVIVFNPEEEFFRYFATLCENAETMIVIDNGSIGETREKLNQLVKRHDSHLIRNDGNIGVAAAFNQAVRSASEQGYRWLLLFDQDSVPLCDMRDYFLEIYTSYSKPDALAVIGTGYIDRNKTPPVNKAINTEKPWKEKKTVITSGGLLSLDAYDVIGPFREELFIDMVDREYCYRARSRGYHVVQSTTPLISHSIGTYAAHKILGKTVWLSHHSALRKYFMVRNRLIVKKQYDLVSTCWRFTALLKTIRKCFYVLLFEAHKFAKVRAMMTGWWHGINAITTPPLWIRDQVAYVWGSASRQHGQDNGQ